MQVEIIKMLEHHHSAWPSATPWPPAHVGLLALY
jgi:hypothetical protein